MQKQVFIGISALVSYTVLISPAVALDPTKSLASVPYMMPGPTAKPQAAPSTPRKRTAIVSSQSHMERGMALLSKQDLDRALIEFLNAAKDNPLNIKAYYEQAVIFNQKGYGKLAQSALQQALTIKPDYKDARVLLASIYLQGGNISQAAGELVRSLGLSPLKAPLPPGATHNRSANAVAQTSTAAGLNSRQKSLLESQFVQITKADDHVAGERDNIPSAPFTIVSHADGQQTRNAPQTNTSSSTPGGASKEEDSDQQLLDKILGRSPGQPAEQKPEVAATPPVPPPASNAVSQPEQPKSDNDNTPPGTVRTISATSSDAQQLLKQITTARQQGGFTWPNPFNWFKHTPAPTPSTPPAAQPPVKHKQPAARTKPAAKPHIHQPEPAKISSAANVPTAPNKNPLFAFFDRLFGSQNRAPAIAANPVKPKNKAPSRPINQKLANQSQPLTTIANVPDDGTDFIVRPEQKQPAAQQPANQANTAGRRNINNSANAASTNAQTSSAANAVNQQSAVVAHGMERLQIQPSSEPPDTFFKRLVSLPAYLFGHDTPTTSGYAAANSNAASLAYRTGSGVYVESMGPAGPPRLVVRGSAPPPLVHVKQTPSTPQPPEAEPVASAPSNVTLPPVPALNRSAAPARVAPALPPQVTGGINTNAMYALLQLLPADVADSVQLALLPNSQLSIPAACSQTQAANAGHYVASPQTMVHLRPPIEPAAPTANVQARPSGAGAARGAGNQSFATPPLLLPKHYVLKAVKPSMAPVPAVAQTPKKTAAPQQEEDIYSMRMKYLLAHGTGSLSPGEAFMFSEETGEGVLFLPNKTSIRRKIAEPQGHDKIAQLRRPDILNHDGWQYSLSLLGKIINPLGNAPNSQNSANNKQPLAKPDLGLFDWLKTAWNL